ncbi:MAG: class I SAM-dependent methyltransferase [Lachnospiraceae bacterium]|nr:class I SAM-dependent methyltransferase [Lachnospiraceae bacterium]
MKKLSPRLCMCAGMVTPGNTLTDVGCDHAGLAIWLVEKGVCPGAVASDVARGPLSNAEREIETAGLTDRIDTVLSDGLKDLSPERGGTLVLAGMGAALMLKILSDSPEKTSLFAEYVFQPQSEDELMRRSLQGLGIRIEDEKDLYEGNKYYHAMRCTRGEAEDPGIDLPDRILFRYGPVLLKNRGECTKRHVRSELLRYRKALEENERNGGEDSESRCLELAGYVKDCEITDAYLNQKGGER